MIVTASWWTGVESDLQAGDSAPGELSVHQQTGDQAPPPFYRDQQATRQEQVKSTWMIFFPWTILSWFIGWLTDQLIFKSLVLIRLLEQKMQELESGHHEELVTLQEERSSLQQMVARQNSVITELQTHLDQATGNNSILLSQQQQLTDTVNSLLKLCSMDRGSGGTGWILGPMFPVTESINKILWGMNIIA